MVNDLKELMRDNVASPPPAHPDLGALVAAGQGRVRNRRVGVAASAAVSVIAGGIVVLTGAVGQSETSNNRVSDDPAASASRTVHLSDAAAISRSDYRVLATYTNKNLDQDNGQYFDGVTNDGLILFRDGPRADQLHPRMALLDPKTGRKDWLPDLRIGQTQTWPVQLGTDRLILVSGEQHLVAYVYDRGTRQWTTMRWPGLPDAGQVLPTLGPDGRLYVSVPATQGQPPVGGWPTGPNGDAEDADADGDTYNLWSVSLTDTTDVRNERQTVGDIAFTPDSMVWTDRTNGKAGMVHVRNLASGKEHTFDPHLGPRCNLLAFGATEQRMVLSQYCGHSKNGARDDRVQIMTSKGDQVITIQDGGIEGTLAGLNGANDIVSLTSYKPGQGGTYLYNLRTRKFVRLSKAVSKWALGGPTPSGQILWSTPTNRGHGAKEWLGHVGN